MMNSLIDDRSSQRDPLINGLFVPRKEHGASVAIPSAGPSSLAPQPVGTPGEASTGTLWTLKNGYGFISPEKGGPNMFFFHGDVVDVDFLDLRLGEKVQFVIGQNERGLCAKQVRPLRLANQDRESVNSGLDAPVEASGPGLPTTGK
jgi:cold shock CspA family protein